MRAILLIAVLSTWTTANAGEPAKTAAPAAVAPAPTNQDCLQCHEASKAGEPGVLTAAFEKSVHASLGCIDCHAGYTAPGPHELAAPADAADAALLARLAAGKTADGQPRTSAPRAYLACAGCHSDSVESFRASGHAKWLGADKAVAGPTCASCHGTPHAVTKGLERTDPKFRAYWAGLAKRCEGCHDDRKFVEAAKLGEEVALNYHDSIHGRLVAIGSQRAPLCTDCHGWSVRGDAKGALKGGHATLSGKEVAASTVAFSSPPRNDDNRVQTCGQCHKGATASFAALISHKPLQESGPIPHFVHVMFSYLTTLTLLFFAFHVLIDFLYEIRHRFAKKHEVEPELLTRTVVRFDIHQRIQHWFMLAGVILLAITGWPLRGAGAVESIGMSSFEQRVDVSRKFLALFGGAHGAGVVHRVAAAMIILSGVYHLLYLTFLAKKKTLPLSMVPALKDAFDIRDNILFMLGLKKDRPKFERFNYLEKFDYWAVFWGIIMMVGSGFIFWFPVQFSRFLPTFVLSSAQIVHGEEATLAAIFLFVVHFYNVHLKPSIFPMNWAWLNGQTTLEYMKDEHAAEYERVFRKEE
ncbi:MAG TPA: cytochrome b/b6 domain-containing protein [Anaeromyxobacteraceae bacterium]